MLCEKCRCELRIVNSFAQIRDGAVYLAHDLMCENPNCEANKRRIPSKRVLSLFNRTQDERGVYCCGAALAYVDGKNYSVPDSSAIESCENDLLTLKCPTCGKLHELAVGEYEYVV